MPNGACGRTSPILYTVTCIILFLAARALYDARIGFWSAVVFATLPAASFSSLLVSTDVPLILFWTLAFFGWIRLIETHEMRFAALIGASIGLGLLAKYAAAYFCSASRSMPGATRVHVTRFAAAGASSHSRLRLCSLRRTSVECKPQLRDLLSHRRKCRLEGHPQSRLCPRVYRLAICRVRSDPVCGAHRRCLAGGAARLRAA